MARVKIEFPDRVLFSHDVPVRVTDLNYGKHLGHDVLVSILHEARARFFRHFGMEEWDTDGCRLLVVDLAVRYRSEALFGQVLKVEIAAGDVGSRGCELLYRVSDRYSSEEVAVAKTGVVFVNRESGQLDRLPDRVRAVIKGGG